MYHIVGDLPLAGYESAAVVVGGGNRAVVPGQDFPERLVGGVGQVDDNASVFEGIEEGLAPVQKPALGTGAMAVGAGAVVGMRRRIPSRSRAW